MMAMVVVVSARPTADVESGMLRASVYTNAMLISPHCTTNVTVGDGVLVPFAANRGARDACTPPASASGDVWGVRWDGVLSGGKDGDLVTMAVNVTGAVRLWVHQWKVVEEWDTTIVGATHIARFVR